MQPFWARRKASYSGRHHGTCLHIDFHGTDRDGERHGGHDRRFVFGRESVGCVEEDVAHVSFCVLGDRVWQHRWTAFLVVLLEYRVSIPRVKTKGPAFIGCTWQWPC